MKLEEMLTKDMSQAEMVEDFKTRKTNLYKKIGTAFARKAIKGEKISTEIDGEVETTNTTKENDVIRKGPKGELYIVSNAKFKSRYKDTDKLSDEFKEFDATGLIRAYQYKGNHFSIKFIASWGEEMICKEGDYLATTVKNETDENVEEVYRIESSVFSITYREI